MDTVMAAGGVSPYDAWTLAAQWVGSVAAIGSVAVAIVFGILTLVNTRQVRDAQARATLAAAGGQGGATGAAQGALFAAPGGGAPFSIRPEAGETWLLTYDGPGDVYDVELAGFTELDRRRLQAGDFPRPQLHSGEPARFVLTSRLTLSGPANVVVIYRHSVGGPAQRRVLLVPAR